MNKGQKLTNTILDFYKSPVAQVSTELFLTIGAVIFFALFAIRPTLITMSDLVNELTEKRKLDLKMSQKIATLATLQGQFTPLQNQAVVLTQAFPDSPDLLYVLKLIERNASEHKLAIQNLQVNDLPNQTQVITTEQSTRISFPLSLTLTGSFESIKNFIDALQNSRRVITVENISFNTQESSNNRTLEATLSLTAHSFGSEK